ncbi:MAG TPA: ComF family protein [Pseudomonadales bacterium]|nr:ComF family protein [Pseudomonadales bacterium]
MAYSPCYLCHAQAAKGEDFCTPCLGEMPWNSRACQQCALPLNDPCTMFCNTCFSTTPPYEKCFASLIYAPPISRLITRYKHQHNEPLGAVLARLMLNTLADDFRDSLHDAVIMAVPMHQHALRQRGFNQAQQLAQSVATHLALPLDTGLEASRAHISQQTLKAEQRRKNLLGIFKYSHSAPKHTLIIDDVMTTGATVSAISELLKQRGCEQISVLCLARTPADGHSPNAG